MPIEDAPRIVVATPRGTPTHGGLVSYQKSVWTRPELSGFHEMVDRTQVEIVAVNEFHVGLAHMYRALRAADSRSTREVRVFPSAAEAQAWLVSPPTSPPAAAS